MAKKLEGDLTAGGKISLQRLLKQAKEDQSIDTLALVVEQLIGVVASMRQKIERLEKRNQPRK